ncbi:MAG: hypothetical protein ACRDWE_03050, partial [Acidimicrobiales bacterium]
MRERTGTWARAIAACVLAACLLAGGALIITAAFGARAHGRAAHSDTAQSDAAQSGARPSATAGQPAARSQGRALADRSLVSAITGSGALLVIPALSVHAPVVATGAVDGSMIVPSN